MTGARAERGIALRVFIGSEDVDCRPAVPRPLPVAAAADDQDGPALETQAE